MKGLALLASVVLGMICTATSAATGPTIALQRTECFGTCPVYTVTVGPTLEVTFVGKDHVHAKGVSRGATSPGNYLLLSEAVRDVLKFRDSYASPRECGELWATDHPGLVLSVSTPDYDKRIALNFGCRGAAVRADVEAIGKLGELVDRTLDTQRWIGDQSER